METSKIIAVLPILVESKFQETFKKSLDVRSRGPEIDGDTIEAEAK